MRSSKVTGSKILGLGLIAGIISVAAFAEPAVQPGETLESLSQAKVTTTVNGQPGSLQELAASGKIKILGDSAQVTEAPASEVATSDAIADETATSEVVATEEAPASGCRAIRPHWWHAGYPRTGAFVLAVSRL